MAITDLPQDICNNYCVYDWQHAIAILKNDFANEYEEIISVMRNFRLLKSEILTKGGRESPISKRLNSSFYGLGWGEKSFNIVTSIDKESIPIPTHKVDCVKNRVCLEMEWNNKDEFFDRDLNNFRLLYELNALSVGIIVTRSDELQQIFNELGKGNSYGTSSTHWSKLIPRIEGRGSGGCPVLAFGIKKDLYEIDC